MELSKSSRVGRAAPNRLNSQRLKFDEGIVFFTKKLEIIIKVKNKHKNNQTNGKINSPTGSLSGSVENRKMLKLIYKNNKNVNLFR